MEPATVSVENKTLVIKPRKKNMAFWKGLTTATPQPEKEYSWDVLTKATIVRNDPTLCDELAVIFDTEEDGKVFITEDDPNFHTVLEALKINEELPNDWYIQAESGNVFVVKLNNKI